MIALRRRRPCLAVSLLLLLQPVHAESPEGCAQEDGSCPATGSSAIQQRARSGLMGDMSEEGSSGTEVTYYKGARIITHVDSEVKRTGSGRWVITIEEGCTDADVQKMAEHMPPGTSPVFEGKPDEGGLCMFVMTGTQEQVKEELDTHTFPSPPVFETDKTWEIIPEMPDSALLEVSSESRPGSPRSWGLDRIDDRSGLDSDYSPPAVAQGGAGAHVYVMDTGIRTTHSDFSGRAIPTLEVVGQGLTECQATDTTCALDRQGHGTHCAGSVGGLTFGVAPACTLHAVKVLADNGAGSFSWLMEAIDWVLRNPQRPAIASMSLGAQGSISTVSMAITRAVGSGLTVVVAAGNQGPADACGFTPAGVSDAITVGSTTFEDERSSFSNTGSCVDIFAPGSDIVSAGHWSDTASTTLSGTSMACPHVAGAAALILGEDSGRSPADILRELLTRSTTGAISDVGRSSPNKLLYTEPPPTPAPGPSTSPVPTPPPTPAPVTCGFEYPPDNGVFCGTWLQSTWDQLDWTQTNVATPSAGTGPDGAASGSYYLFAEASGAAQGNKAALESTYPVTLDGAHLSFKYHMNAFDARLRVKVGRTTVWERLGRQGNNWMQADVDLSSGGSGDRKVYIVYSRGTSWENDVGIDDVSLQATAAPAPVPAPATTTTTALPQTTTSPTPSPPPQTPSPTPAPTPEEEPGPPGPAGAPGPAGPPGPPGPPR